MNTTTKLLEELKSIFYAPDYELGYPYMGEVSNILGDLARSKDPAILRPLWFIRVYDNGDYDDEMEEIIETCAHLDDEVWIPEFVEVIGNLHRHGSVRLIKHVVLMICLSGQAVEILVSCLKTAPNDSRDYLSEFTTEFLGNEDYSRFHSGLSRIRQGLDSE